jgi:hypothetical protein
MKHVEIANALHKKVLLKDSVYVLAKLIGPIFSYHTTLQQVGVVFSANVSMMNIKPYETNTHPFPTFHPLPRLRRIPALPHHNQVPQNLMPSRTHCCLWRPRKLVLQKCPGIVVPRSLLLQPMYGILRSIWQRARMEIVGNVGKVLKTWFVLPSKILGLYYLHSYFSTQLIAGSHGLSFTAEEKVKLIDISKLSSDRTPGRQGVESGSMHQTLARISETCRRTKELGRIRKMQPLLSRTPMTRCAMYQRLYILLVTHRKAAHFAIKLSIECIGIACFRESLIRYVNTYEDPSETEREQSILPLLVVVVCPDQPSYSSCKRLPSM